MITNSKNEVLKLRPTYGDQRWGLPGGAIEPGESIHETLVRECKEELGLDVITKELTGIYYHKTVESQVVIIRCEISEHSSITLSSEHSEFRYFPVSELSEVQKTRINDCLNFNGIAVSRKF